MDIRGRILQYLEYKKISKYQFYKEIGVSNGFLDKNGAIGSDKCEKISYQYPDLNLVWLITAMGDMISNPTVNDKMPMAASPASEYKTGDKYTQQLEKENRRLIAEVERKQEMIDSFMNGDIIIKKETG
ncbi:MAG: hypothetical protein WCG93_16610 [Paludibacter sp.]